MIDTTSIYSFLHFDQDNSSNFITDEYAFSTFSIEGSNSISVIKDVWQMDQNVYLYNSSFQYPENFDMSIGFFINPLNDGLIKSQDSDDLIGFNKAILGFEVLDNNFNTKPIISVYENVTSSGNRILLQLYGNGSPSKFYSICYEASSWHYVWIELIDITTGDIDIYIDGVNSSIDSEINTFPIDLGFLTYCNYSINKVLYNNYGDVRNNASIKDILILDGQLNNLAVHLQKIINNGTSFAINSDSYYEDFGILYNDIDTRSITSIISQKDNYIVGTNYGSIYESLLSLWNVQNNFQYMTEDDILYLYEFSDNASYSFDNETGFLTLISGSIKGF